MRPFYNFYRLGGFKEREKITSECRIVVDCASLPSWKDNITPWVRIPLLAPCRSRIMAITGPCQGSDGSSILLFCSNIRLDELVVIVLFKSQSPIAVAEDTKGKGLVRIQSRIQIWEG